MQVCPDVLASVELSSVSQIVNVVKSRAKKQTKQKRKKYPAAALISIGTSSCEELLLELTNAHKLFDKYMQLSCFYKGFPKIEIRFHHHRSPMGGSACMLSGCHLVAKIVPVTLHTRLSKIFYQIIFLKLIKHFTVDNNKKLKIVPVTRRAPL